MIKRVVFLMLAMLLVYSGLPVQVHGAEEVLLTEELTVYSGEALPSEALYNAYLEDLFYDNQAAFLGEAAREQLGEKEQKLYDFLKETIIAVASGAESSAVVRVTGEQLIQWGGSETYQGATAGSAMSAVIQEFRASDVMSALLHDCPLELYWFDKVTGMKLSGSVIKLGPGEGIQFLYSINFVEFQFSVVADHQPEDYNAKAPTVDTANAAAATAAAENAWQVIQKNAGKNDYQKLKAYKDAICQLVSYNRGVTANDFTTDADPWQLIWVFDGNMNTNVVCEGYAKAFQYLFDCSDFSGSPACYTVTGKLLTAGREEGHMWNIVTLDGENYLVDVTNSDSGTTGQNGSLFLAGGTGSIAEGYTIGSVGFAYDSRSCSLWGTGADSILNLAGKRYDPCTLGHTEVIDPAVEANCGQSGLTEGKHCQVCGEILLEQTLIPASGEHVYEDHVCQVCGQCDEHHTPVTDAAVAPSCTKPGLTEGSHCGVCKLVLVEQAVLPVAAHQEKTLESKAATCTETGLTEGTVCTVCNTVIVQQETIKALGHQVQIQPEQPATCTGSGLTEGKNCTVCGAVLQKQETVPATGHTKVIDKKVNATCGKDGKTEGSHCSVCKTVLKAQAVISATGAHTYSDAYDTTCNGCGHVRPERKTTPMYRMYDPNSSEHFYTGSTEERDILVAAGWNYEGVGFNFPLEGDPVHRLYDPETGEHLYTMNQEEANMLLAQGWNYEGVAFNSAEKDEVPQYRLHNPNASRGAYHFTGSTEERDNLISAGWEFQGIGWYSCLK